MAEPKGVQDQLYKITKDEIKDQIKMLEKQAEK